MIIVKKDKKDCKSPVIIQGEPGPAGEAATIAIGQVETLGAGEEAYVTNVGDETAAVLKFGIPQGANGSNGSDGLNGTMPVLVSGGQANKTMAEIEAAVEAGILPVIVVDAEIVNVGPRDYLLASALLTYRGKNEDLNAEFIYEDSRLRYTATMDSNGHVTFAGEETVKQGDLAAIRTEIDEAVEEAQDYADSKTAAEARARSDADNQLAEGIAAIEGDLTDTKTEMEEALQGIREQMPEELPNPYTLTFTGAVSAEYDGRSNVTVNIPTGGEGGSGRDTKIIEFTVSGGAFSPCAYTPAAIEAMAAGMNILGHVASQNKWFTYAGMDSYGTNAMFNRLAAAEADSDYQCVAEYLLVSGSKAVTQVYKEIGGEGGGGEAELLTVTGTLDEITEAGIRGYTTDKTWQEIDDANAAGKLVVLRTESEVIPMTRQVGAIIYFEGLNLEHTSAPGMTRAFIARARPNTAIIQPLELHPAVDAADVTYGDTNVAAELESLNENKINEPTTDGTAGQVLTTDGNGGRTWTTPQGGASTLELIERITTTEQVNKIGLTGVNLKMCLIRIEYPAGTTSVSAGMTYSMLDENGAVWTANNYSLGGKYGFFACYAISPYWLTITPATTIGNLYAVSNLQSNFGNYSRNRGNITGAYASANGSNVFPAGTLVEIWGVRA